MGANKDLKRSSSVAHKVAVLGASMAVVAFTCGFVGSKLVMDKTKTDKVGSLQQSAQASICGDGYLDESSSCYSEKTETYYRSWLLWKDTEVDDEWPEAINNEEESLHAARFDGVLPTLAEQALQVLQIKDAQEVDAAVFEAVVAELASSTSTPVLTDSSGEGGRRLAEDDLDDDETETSSLTLSVYNSYTADSKGRDVNTEYPWTYMVEPYRATTLELGDTNSLATYRWSIDGHVHGFGTSVDAVFSEIGYHAVKVEEMVVNDDGTISINKLCVKVMCKYVRREIRALSNLDRETWLSAISVLQHVPTVVGKSLYGSKYLSKDSFVRVHLYYGGAMDCDHWHQGAGFVTSHIALTLQFEQALQSINPTIATPYWDFTLESTFFGSRDWRESFIFADDWFGDASPDNDLHTVSTGRFGFVETLRDCKKFSYWINSYGLLRAPWNNDPTPFLTRSANVYGYYNNMKPSGCAEYHTSLKKTTWMAMSKQLNSAAHGHIHELMGGAWNHYLVDLVNHEDHPSIYTFAHTIQAYSKILWRLGYVECPDSCDMTTAAADCQCTCSAESLAGKSALDVLTESEIIKSVEFFDNQFHRLDKTNFIDENDEPYNPIPGYDHEATLHIHNNLLALLCNPGHLGDMYQATSNQDITFWVIHNTVDRLWHYKRLGNLNNYDETWDPYHTCYGHNPRHYQPFKDLFQEDAVVDRPMLPDNLPQALPEQEGETEQGESKAGIAAPAYVKSPTKAGSYYTNMELYDKLHPASSVLQYVYDDFNWDHCEKIGYQLSNAW